MKKKTKKTIKVKKSEMLREHKHLVRVLESGSKKEQKKEAKKQKGELSEFE